MRAFACLSLLLLTSCTTLGNWAEGSMDWADRTMPTYDDWFGDAPPPQPQYTQQTPAPVPPVQTQQNPPTLSTQQEVYYDNSVRGHSFGK